MQELVPSATSIGPSVAENDGGTATAKESVLDEKATVVAVVKVGRDRLCGDNQGFAVSAATREQLLGEIDTNQGSRATHTG